MSPEISGRSFSTSHSNSSPCCSKVLLVISDANLIISATETGFISHSTFPASILVTSRRSFIRSVNLSPSDIMVLIFFFTFRTDALTVSSSSLRLGNITLSNLLLIIFAKPNTAARGVLNSCDTVDKNSVFILSASSSFLFASFNSRVLSFTFCSSVRL